MATREELIDCLYEIIIRGEQEHGTDLALGREVSLPLSGVLAEARPTHPELVALFEETRRAKIMPELAMSIGWSGDKDTGEQVIILSMPKP